jgi:hypothetical protein
VTFSPDLAKFKLKELSADMISLFQRRVVFCSAQAYDLAGIVDKKVHVFLNGKRHPGPYLPRLRAALQLDQESVEFVHEEVNNR